MLFYCREIAEGCFGGTGKANHSSLIKHDMTAREKGAELFLSFSVSDVIFRDCRLFFTTRKKKEKGFSSLLLCVKPTRQQTGNKVNVLSCLLHKANKVTRKEKHGTQNNLCKR